MKGTNYGGRYLGVAVVILGLFLVFTRVVSKELLVSWDFDLLVRVQDALPVKLDPGWMVFSGLAGMEFVLIILALWSLWKRSWLVVWVWVGLGVGLGVVFILKQILHHPGPVFMFYRGSGEFGFSDYYLNTAYSYPSGHVFRISYLLSVMVLGTENVMRGRFWVAGGMAGVVVVLVGLAKVVLGHHWMSDVIGGGLLGVGSAALVFGLVRLVGEFLAGLSMNKKVADNEA